MAQVDKTKKLRILQASNNAAQAMLKRFTLIDGMAKNKIAKIPM